MIKRADGRWQEQITITERGKKKRKYFYGATQREVKQKMVTFQESLATGRTFDLVEDEWEQSHFERIAHGTQMCYAPAIKRASSAFGALPINQLSPIDIDRSVQLMAKQGYSHQSVKIYLSVLRQICDYAVLAGDLPVNPTASVHLPRNLPKKERELPSDDIINAITAHVDLPFGLFAYFLMLTGLRRGEALALQWQDIDFNAQLIHVSKSIYFDHSRPVVKTPKTKAGTRDVILLQRLADQLLPHEQLPTDYIFGGTNPLYQEEFIRCWNTYSLAAGIAHTEKRHIEERNREYDKTVIIHHVTPHQLRHAFATFLYEADVDISDAKDQLGHSSISITRDIYTHIRKTRKVSTAKKLNRAIDTIIPAEP